MTEREKMLSGELYLATERDFMESLARTKDMCWEYNNLRPSLEKDRNEMLRKILGQADEDTFIVQPFYCDYGTQIKVGKRFFANFNFVVLDEAYVTIGDDCFIGPNVGIYTACHSTDPVERNTRQEWAKPVSIGNNCWIGGSVTILPGVTIGDNVTIGAGSVVVKDIPSNSVAVGNPARVIKCLDKDEIKGRQMISEAAAMGHSMAMQFLASLNCKPAAESTPTEKPVCAHNPAIDCPCPKECPRHGKCCACVAHHREHGKLPACLRNQSTL